MNGLLLDILDDVFDLNDAFPEQADSVPEVRRRVERGVLRCELHTLRHREELGVVNASVTDQGCFVRRKPLHALALFPQTVLALLFTLGTVLTQPVLLPAIPVPEVVASVRPSVDAIPVFFVFCVLSLVPAAITPLIAPNAIHVIVSPFPLIVPPVEPLVDALHIEPNSLRLR